MFPCSSKTLYKQSCTFSTIHISSLHFKPANHTLAERRQEVMSVSTTLLYLLSSPNGFLCCTTWLLLLSTYCSIWLQRESQDDATARLICLTSQTVTSPQRPGQLSQTASHTLTAVVCSLLHKDLHKHTHAKQTKVSETVGEKKGTDGHRETTHGLVVTHFHVVL